MIYFSSILVFLAVVLLCLVPLIDRIDTRNFYKRSENRRLVHKEAVGKRELKILKKIELKLLRAGFKISPLIYVLLCILSSCAGFYMIQFIFHSRIFSVPAAVGAFFIPNTLLGIRIAKRRDKMMKQFVEMLDNLNNYLITGLSFRTALERLSLSISDPLRGEILQVLADIKKGIPESQAVRSLVKDRVTFMNFKQFATVVTIHSKIGGNMATSLESLSTLIKDRKEMDQQKRANTTQARISSVIVGLAPFIMFLIMWLIAREYVTTALDDIRGKVGYVAAFSLSVIGFVVVRRMARVGEEV